MTRWCGRDRAKIETRSREWAWGHGEKERVGWAERVALTYMNVKVLVTQSSWILCDPIDCSPPGSSVHGILQARILECTAIAFSRGSSWPRDWTCNLLHCRQILYHWATREARIYLFTPPCIKQITSGKMLYTQGAQWGACDDLERWDAGWKGGSGGRGCTHIYSWFTLLYTRN